MVRQTVQIGEIIPSMVKELEKGLLACIAKNQHRDMPYYILFTGNWFRNGEELRTIFRSSYRCPPKMLNTICWKVDNKSSRCEEVWVLPLDAPTQPIKTDGVSVEIAEAARGMPLIYPSRELN